MKIKTIVCAVFAATLMSSCNYDDGELWNAVNGQEERISALEKWQKTVAEQLKSLQGILTATDYVTDVERVTKDGKEGYKISFLHKAPITLYYNEDSEVSGSSDEVVGVAQEEDTGKWYWTLNGKPLKVENKTVYVNGSDDIKVEINSDGSTKLSFGTNEVIVPGPITHPVTGVVEDGNVVTISLNGGAAIDVPKYLNLSNLLLNEYAKEDAGEQIYDLNLPQGYVIKMLDVIPQGWIMEVTDAALKVVYPSSGEAVMTFLISDGKTQTVMKTVTFKVTSQETWTSVEFLGSGNKIVIPAGAANIRVTTKLTSLTAVDVRDDICEILKRNENVINIDMSSLPLSVAFPANAFLVDANAGAIDLTKCGQNNSIVSITLPASIPNIFNYAFANCKALKSITIPGDLTNRAYSDTWFAGCENFETIYVRAEKVIAYKTAWSAVAGKIQGIPTE